MNNILLATGSQKSADVFKNLLSEVIGEGGVISVMEGSRARLRLKEADIDLVIINTPMKDEQGIEFALHAADGTMNAVILVTNPDAYDRVRSHMEEHGIITMKRPIEKKRFAYAVRDCIILNQRIRFLKSQNEDLKISIEETKIVNRAKGMLMSHLKMTEAQAHRYIEKQAMDLRVSKKTIAQNILRTYYNK